jgi:hypothetical protein
VTLPLGLDTADLAPQVHLDTRWTHDVEKQRKMTASLADEKPSPEQVKSTFRQTMRNDENTPGKRSGR